MINTVESNKDKYLTVSSVDVTEIEKYSNNVYDDTFHTIPYTESVISGTGWKESVYNGRNQIITEVTGDSASFEFEGNVIRLRGAHVGGDFTVEITNEDGTTITETKTVGENTSSTMDVLYTNTTLPGGKHTITITRNTGKLAIHGISVNGVIPEEGYKSEEEFHNKYADILEKTIGSFSCSFDDLKEDVVDAGWVKADTVAWEVVDGKLALTGGINADKGECDGISIDVSENEADIIYLGLDFINTESTGIRIINGDTLATDEMFGMIYENPAGVFVRDADNKATRFKAEDKWWPEAGVTHRLELILNYKNNNYKMYIDGVEATYTNGAVSTQGGTTIKGTSLNKLKIGLSAKTTVPVYLDNLDLMGYDDYLEREILSFDIYDSNASEKFETLKARVKYLDDNEKPVNAEAKAEITVLEEKIEAVANAKPILTPSENNTELIGTRQLFTFACNGISEVYVNGKDLTEDVDYAINGDMIFFEADVFEEIGNNVAITDNDGKIYVDYLELREAKTEYYPLYPARKAAEGVKFTGISNDSSPFVADSAYSKNAANVYQVYQGSEASVTFSGREALKGTYNVEWYDISATHSTNGIYAMPKLNLEVKDTKGISGETLNMNCDNTWKDLGKVTFSGSADEYIKVSNGENLALDPGKRFFAEIIRFTESCDESVLWKEFLELPENITIFDNNVNSNIANLARIISIDGNFSMDYVESVYVNDATVDYDVNGRNIFIPEMYFENAGEYTLKVKLVDGTETNALSFSLIKPESVIYTWKDANATTVTETTDVATAGANNSRTGVAPLKIGKENQAIVPTEGKTLDEAVYVKWDLTGIAEGDYLVDTWLPAGWLAKALKAEVVSDGGATTKVYRNIHLGSVRDEVVCYTEGYFGNGAKIHFTGKGNEYIKLMLDDDYLSTVGMYLLIDSIRLTPWYDMNSVYDEFYGDSVVTLDGVEFTTVSGTNADGENMNSNVAEITFNSKYAMNKLGYTLYFATYDAEGRFEGVARKCDVAIFDGDTNATVRLNLTSAGVNTIDKTYKVFLWGSDLDPDNDTSMKPYIK